MPYKGLKKPFKILLTLFLSTPGPFQDLNIYTKPYRSGRVAAQIIFLKTGSIWHEDSNIHTSHASCYMASYKNSWAQGWTAKALPHKGLIRTLQGLYKGLIRAV